MSKLQDEICRILDFDPNNYWATAWQEAVVKEKLVYTWMRVNGEVYCINKFVPDSDTVLVSNSITSMHEKVVETLEVFLPESGMYTDGVNCVYINKKPLKQWKKSYHPGFYQAEWVQKKKVADFEQFLGEAKLVPFFVSEVGALYKNQTKIGTAKDGIISLTDYNFYQDVVDWVEKEKLEWKLQ